MKRFPEPSRATLQRRLSCAPIAGPPSPPKPHEPLPATVVIIAEGVYCDAFGIEETCAGRDTAVAAKGISAISGNGSDGSGSPIYTTNALIVGINDEHVSGFVCGYTPGSEQTSGRS